MACFKRPIEPYIIAVTETDKASYQQLRVVQDEALAA